MSLPLIPFGALRLASPGDLLRIGIVAAAGFRYSPVFDWERPYHEEYPGDTLLSYRQEFSSVMKDENYAVLVAVDHFDPMEHEKTKAIIPQDNGWDAPAAGEEVVVGVGCWKLEPGSKRIGEFQNDTGPYPSLPPNQNQDQEQKHGELFGDRMGPIEKRYFHGYSTMDMLVVHPAYWRRGHGTTLGKWGLDLARIDGVKQGVMAASSGKKLYTSMGYTNLEDVHIDGDEITPDGVTISAMVFEPGNGEGSAHGETAQIGSAEL
ncbi:hypothetical protein KVR01_000248 [Diaporthe batatas]|uniref:uncharacterized protein n=1 Tax=Diaporthe batatas TaxID=748121 RepID=UPI001D04A6D3|nr:uncharacterized protein KVR01_000248 [Diaporthe batatas]KAG8169503.1 hypothetical protein KVR01_000248 [Diaporthe batatas]